MRWNQFFILMPRTFPCYIFWLWLTQKKLYCRVWSTIVISEALCEGKAFTKRGNLIQWLWLWLGSAIPSMYAEIITNHNRSRNWFVCVCHIFKWISYRWPPITFRLLMPECSAECDYRIRYSNVRMPRTFCILDVGRVFGAVLRHFAQKGLSYAIDLEYGLLGLSISTS